MKTRAELEARRAVLQTMLGTLYAELNTSKGKMEGLELEYALTEDHAAKLEENISFLRKEAQVVIFKEYKSATEAYRIVQGTLENLGWQLDEARTECKQLLRRAEARVEELKTVETALAQEAIVFQFPNDKRRNQDAD